MDVQSEIPKGCGQANYCKGADGAIRFAVVVGLTGLPVMAAIDHKWFYSASIF